MGNFSKVFWAVLFLLHFSFCPVVTTTYVDTLLLRALIAFSRLS